MSVIGRRLLSPMRVVAASLGLVLIGLGVFGVTGAGSALAVGAVHAPIVGSGSTWSANALQQWIRNVWANYQWKITYSESGSTQGRNDFANGTADFGVSEIPYGIANSNEGDARPAREFAYMPIVAGGTAFMYNIEIGGKRVTNLRLSGSTLARIFTGAITVWNDPQIAADNPQLALPAIPIVPVVRSDGSGTAAQFTIWMRQEQPAIWDEFCGKVGRPIINGHCGVTSNFPTLPGAGFVARSGANGVAGYVAQPHAVGSITFVEYSYALNAGFPVAKMLNGSGYYTEPTAANVAVALLRARINEDINSPDYTVQDLSGVYTNDDRRTYPLSSYSYIILPKKEESNFTQDKGSTLADFGAYFLCEGQQQAETLGYSPLPKNLVEAGQRQIKKVPGGNPTIQDIASCNNPTFSPDGTNRLANEAPYPPECDKQGPIQCSDGTGGAKGKPTAPQEVADAASGDVGTAAAVDLADAPAADAATAVGAARPQLVNAAPQAVPVSETGVLPAFAMLGAGGGLLAVAVLPPLLGRGGRRQHLTAPTRGSPIR